MSKVPTYEYNKYKFHYEFVVFDYLSADDFIIYDFYKAFKTDKEAIDYNNVFLETVYFDAIYNRSVYNVTNHQFVIYGFEE